jgi:hypothetical protein
MRPLLAAWLLGLDLASGCSVFPSAGLRLDALSADGSGRIQLKLWFAESAYSYEPASSDCGDKAVLQYDWTTGSLQPIAEFNAQSPDLGPVLDLAGFTVSFRVGEATVQTTKGEVIFALPSLQSPESATFWASNGRVYFYYQLASVDDFELSICSPAHGTCVLDTAGSLHRYVVKTSDDEFPRWEPAVYERAGLVELSTLDSCYSRLFFRSGSVAVTPVEGLSGFLTVSTVVKVKSSKGRVGYYASVTDGILRISRVDLATGETIDRQLDEETVREQMLAPCSPPAPRPGPPPHAARDRAPGQQGRG